MTVTAALCSGLPGLGASTGPEPAVRDVQSSRNCNDLDRGILSFYGRRVDRSQARRETSNAMTRTLYLLRHAKSDWSNPDVRDHDRVLAPRGLRAAKQLAAHVAKKELEVDRIYASSAQRVRETIQLVRPGLGDAPLTFRRSLYLIGGDELIAFIQALPDRHHSVMVVAHDPGLHEAAVALLASDQKNRRKAFARVKAKFPTGALLGMTFDADTWAEVRPGFGKLCMFVRPRDLDAPG